jgi:FkbM family methyltransferase
MLKSLHTALQFNRLTQIVDVGANPIDGDPPYKELLKNGLCQIVGFEPQQNALAKLDASKSPYETYLPYAVGDGTVKTLNLCKYSGFTSTLKPHAPTLEIFRMFGDGPKIVNQARVETKRLDDIEEIGEIDFLKIDIQGGELDVFRNARHKLARAVVIQTEISFVNLYESQPSFGEVDIELRAQGFIPHSFVAIKNGIIAPFVINNNPSNALNQLLEADITYVKDFRETAKLDDDQLKNMCLIAHACYRSFDLAFRCIFILQERKALPADTGQRYIDLLTSSQKKN